MNEIEINGKKYVLKSDVNTLKVKNKKGMELCIVRTYSAGVFYGWIDRRIKGMEHTIYDSRRLWSWYGAASLSQLANEGVNKPSDSKFAQVVSETDLKEIIEIIPCTEKARDNIDMVKIWEV